MERAPKKESPNKLSKAAKVAMTAASIGIAATSPINKVISAPAEGAPTVTEKQIVRPKDLKDAVLKDEIDKNRATFQVEADGQVKRIESKDE